MNEKTICPSCKAKFGLYKHLEKDDKWHTNCLHCNREIEVRDYHFELKDIKELPKD